MPIKTVEIDPERTFDWGLANANKRTTPILYGSRVYINGAKTDRSALPGLHVNLFGLLTRFRQLWDRYSQNAVFELCVDFVRIHTLWQAKRPFERAVPSLR